MPWVCIISWRRQDSAIGVHHKLEETRQCEGGTESADEARMEMLVFKMAWVLCAARRTRANVRARAWVSCGVSTTQLSKTPRSLYVRKHCCNVGGESINGPNHLSPVHVCVFPPWGRRCVSFCLGVCGRRVHGHTLLSLQALYTTLSYHNPMRTCTVATWRETTPADPTSLSLPLLTRSVC